MRARLAPETRTFPVRLGKYLSYFITRIAPPTSDNPTGPCRDVKDTSRQTHSVRGSYDWTLDGGPHVRSVERYERGHPQNRCAGRAFPKGLRCGRSWRRVQGCCCAASAERWLAALCRCNRLLRQKPTRRYQHLHRLSERRALPAVAQGKQGRGDRCGRGSSNSEGWLQHRRVFFFLAEAG